METIAIFARIDWHQVAETFAALYLGVSTVLGLTRGFLVALEKIAEATITEDDDRAIERVIAWVDSAQAFMGKWAGRLSLIPARPKR